METAPKKKSALVICPGRGSYNAGELGYLNRFHSDKPEFINMIDAIRETAGQITISDLCNADLYSPNQQGRGDNASLLIYTCAIADFLSINKDLYDIVGVTGNSMGWYLSLAAGGALSLEDGASLVNTMGQIMTNHGIGRQIVCSIVNSEWQYDPVKLSAVEAVLEHSDVYRSINLGGLVVLATGEAGAKYAMETLPKEERFPFQLRGHSAFHSPLLSHCRELARQVMKPEMFMRSLAGPNIPLIDGAGNIWSRYSSNLDALYAYTLGPQIDDTYDFSKAVEVGIKEFAPEVIIILGPGTSLGAPVAQTLISQNWQGLTSKSDFKARQDSAPFVLSMGIEEHRKHVI